MTDDQGQGRSCQVELDMAPIRGSQFRPDADLQQPLWQRCRQLERRELPGKREYRQGQERFPVKVDSSPWKGGPNPGQACPAGRFGSRQRTLASTQPCSEPLLLRSTRGTCAAH